MRLAFELIETGREGEGGMGRSRRTPAGSGMGKAGKFPRLAVAALVTFATIVVFTTLQGSGVRYKPSDRLEGVSVVSQSTRAPLTSPHARLSS